MNEHNTPIFSDVKMPTKEYGIPRCIEVSRLTDGGVVVIIGSWTERSDRTVRRFHLSAEKAEILGQALLCMDDNDLTGLIDRASNFMEDKYPNITKKAFLRSRGD